MKTNISRCFVCRAPLPSSMVTQIMKATTKRCVTLLIILYVQHKHSGYLLTQQIIVFCVGFKAEQI